MQLAYANPAPATVLRPDSPVLRELFDQIRAGAAERDRERILPFDIIERIRQSGLGALRVPVAEGGHGASLRDLFSIVIALAAADPNVAHILRNHFVGIERILHSPRSERNRRWLRAAVEGAIFSLAATELGAKRSGSLEVHVTRLTRDGNGYRLNGEKYYSTGCLYADYLSIPVLTPDEVSATVIIPARREGVELVDDWDGFGQRLTGTGTTRLANVRVEADEVVLPDDADNRRFAYFSTVPQLFVTTLNAGIAQAAVDEATALVHKRPRTFYHAVAETAADDPLLQGIVGQLTANAFAARSIVLAAADALDALVALGEGEAAALDAAALHASLVAAQAKLTVDELAIRSASQLFEVGGASTAKRSENLDRHWRNARTLASHNPAVFKARALGDYQLNGKRPPNLGFF
jgi:alkylation response protein AidB-like acyl-CoA dehydrogenase